MAEKRLCILHDFFWGGGGGLGCGIMYIYVSGRQDVAYRFFMFVFFVFYYTHHVVIW